MAYKRSTVVAQAQAWIGCKESDGSHKQIIDVYNSHTPLARGYKVQYTDAWCATFVSAVAIKVGYTAIIPTECGCDKMIALFKNLGCWMETDSYVPSAGDVIFYDWDDSGSGDNTGSSDHVGIVEKVSGSTITVIEGNYSDSVKRRTIAVNGRYIRGYGLPKYDGETSSSSGTTTGTTGSSLSVGDTVDFTGTKHYVSANATSAKTCKPGKAKITQIYQLGKSKHPYHLIAVSGGGSNVYGWVDEADISGSTGSTVTHTVVKGDTLSALASKYGSTVAKIVAANKTKYPTMTANYIVVGWVLTIPQ